MQVELPEVPNAQPEPDAYHTLGQFYKAIEQGQSLFYFAYGLFTTKAGFSYLAQTTPTLFASGSVAYQFAPDSVFSPPVADAGGIVQVADLTSALQALSTIVAQGEGAPPGGDFDDPTRAEKDHWAIFSELRNGSATWDVYPTVTDPKTEDYRKIDQKIYQVGFEFLCT